MNEKRLAMQTVQKHMLDTREINPEMGQANWLVLARLNLPKN